MLKSHILCVLFTVCGLSFALATLSGEVAEILRRGGRFFPCMWQVQPGICKNPKILTIKMLCDGLGITLGEFFSTAEFDALEQTIE